MNVELSFEQTRVLGVFIEKEKTTPDQYPLSVNGITTACNQKSNRDPVVSFTEIEVQNIVDELIELKLISDSPDVTGRVAKYRHRMFGSQFSAFNLNSAEAAIIGVLFLRGAQTPGELRTRTQRLHPFNNVKDVEQCLTALSTRDDGPFVVQLAREPGKREARYQHLFSGNVSDIAQQVSAAVSGTNELDRIDALELEVSELRNELIAIKTELGLI